MSISYYEKDKKYNFVHNYEEYWRDERILTKL